MPKNIKSAFEATGISPLDTWCMKEMRVYRAKLQTATRLSSSKVDPSTQRQQAQMEYLELLDDPNATIDKLCDALRDSVSMLEGAGAQIALLSSELALA
ncbi:hypothetical protein FRC09_004269, partial [Ceratobasidium sp. 395]